MATTTGKAARRRYGTRHAAKRSKARRQSRKRFGNLAVSTKRGNAAAFVSAASESDAL